MGYRVKIILIGLIYSSWINAQNISGNLPSLFNQSIRLEGFDGLKTNLISNTTVDEKGNFKLKYSKSDYGIGYLISSDQKPFLIILCGEDIEFIGEDLSSIEKLTITKGKENQWFEQYAREYPLREQALSAWNYLEKVYKLDPMFATKHKPIKNIQKEIQRIKVEDTKFLEELPNDSYVKWFLPMRKLLSSVSTIAQYRTEEIPSTIAALRAFVYTDTRLYKSGLFKDAIESHFWLLENSGKPLDSVFIEMQLSIDAMMVNLAKDGKKLNEVTDYLFDLLERHSLFKASEYLAIKVLTQNNCTLNQDLAMQLETYRAMKKGNIAPDIVFKGDYFTPGYNPNSFPKKLSEFRVKFTLVVFGASWCPKCAEELPEIAKQYVKYKAQDVEVLFISLDEDKELFKNFVKFLPFISVCDYQKWDSEIVKNYYVFGTPTMYLLDNKREIILRPNSAKQMDAWLDWNLNKGN